MVREDREAYDAAWAALLQQVPRTVRLRLTHRGGLVRAARGRAAIPGFCAALRLAVCSETGTGRRARTCRVASRACATGALPTRGGSSAVGGRAH